MQAHGLNSMGNDIDLVSLSRIHSPCRNMRIILQIRQAPATPTTACIIDAHEKEKRKWETQHVQTTLCSLLRALLFNEVFGSRPTCPEKRSKQAAAVLPSA